MKRIRTLATALLAAVCACGGAKPPARTAEPVAQIITHRVEQGESWESLARDFYGDESRAADLARSNGMDGALAPRAGAAVRIQLGAGDAARLERRLDAARDYNAGLDLAAEANYAGAAARFEEALKSDPTFTDASYNLALASGRLGDRAREIRILRDLVSVAPARIEYRYALGAAHFAAGELAPAAEAFSAVLAMDPGNGQALFSLGAVCERQGKKEEAILRYREYLALDPGGEWAEAARERLAALGGSAGGAR